MKYQIIHARNLPDLAEKVNAEIEKGYVPQGGVTINFTTCAQAVYKE